MTTGQPVLPDLGEVMAAFFTQSPTIRTVTSLPEDLAGNVPLLQVVRASGSVFGRRYDRAFFDLNAFGADEDSASALARAAEALLLAPINQTFPDLGAVLGSAESIRRPQWTPYENTNVRLYAATYSIKLRSA